MGTHTNFHAIVVLKLLEKLLFDRAFLRVHCDTIPERPHRLQEHRRQHRLVQRVETSVVVRPHRSSTAGVIVIVRHGNRGLFGPFATLRAIQNVACIC